VFLFINRALRKARRLAEEGKTDLAAKKYKGILEKHPGNEKATEGLRALQQKNVVLPAADTGSLQEQAGKLIELFNQGSLQEALLKGEALAERFPDEPFIPNLLGGVNFSMGRLEQAVESFTRALRINPEFAEAHNNMGNALNALRKSEEALVSFEKALQIKPDFVEAHNNMGNALNALGRHEEAVVYCNKALRIRPDIAEVHNNLGNALLALGRFEEAVVNYKNALQLRPDFAEAHSNLGNALYALEKIEEAVVSYENALQIQPDFDKALNNLGSALCVLGRYEEAIPICNKALLLSPGYAEAHRNLSTAKKYQDDDPQIRIMLGLIERRDLHDSDRMHLGYALGKVYGDIGDHDKAFAYLLEANRLRKEDVGYDICSDRESFVKIKKMFSEDVPVLSVDQETEEGKKYQPVFILGMPRSGTSLIEQILASHSQVYGAGELMLLKESVSNAIGDTLHEEPLPLSPDRLQAIRDSYLEGLEKIGASEPYITDKMPLNFLMTGLILSAMPEAKVIHSKRDARATCWSNFKNYFFTKGNGYAYDLQDVAEYYTMYVDLMSFWHQKYPGRIYDLSYEALTENQEDETRKLLEYIGLEWESQCLKFHENKRAVRTASARQVRKKMYQGSSEEWRKYEKHLGSMVELLRDY